MLNLWELLLGFGILEQMKLRTSACWMLSVVAGLACKTQQTGAEPRAVSVVPTVSALVDSGVHDPVCGGLACELFDRPALAFARVLALKPSVLAIGESHAKKGLQDVSSATAHMTRELLPLLKDVASDLVLELWVADGTCSSEQKKEIRHVASAQHAVTETHAQSNQAEFANLFMAARREHVQPHFLKPACDEYAKIVSAGEGDIDAMLKLIARLSGDQIAALKKENPKLVVAYGGAMHNDAMPRPGLEAWTYGARIRAEQPSYVELDLVIPEFITDSDAWKAQTWYPHFTKGAHKEKAVLYTLRPGAYVLVFPETAVPEGGKRRR
jgi:hypothetical protein